MSDASGDFLGCLMNESAKSAKKRSAEPRMVRCGSNSIKTTIVARPTVAAAAATRVGSSSQWSDGASERNAVHTNHANAASIGRPPVQSSQA